MFVTVPERRKPGLRWATLLLVVLCVASFVTLALVSPVREMAWVMRWGLVPTQLFDASGPAWQRLIDPDLLRLLTALFIHVAWPHLLVNMLFLMIFGLPAEQAMGSRRFMLLFLLGGLLANFAGAMSVATAQAPIIGCSGAVSAVVGVYLVLFPRAKLGLVLPLGVFVEFVRVPAPFLIGLWVLLQLLFTYVGASFGEVVWWSHIAGFLFGVLFALFSRHAVQRRQRLRR